MRTTFLTLCIAIFALFAIHATTPLHAQGGTVEVTASGSAASKGAALTAAYTEAVRQAIAQAVDAGTAARNERIITEEILSRPRGYIKQARAAGESESGGIHTLTITATVDTALILENLSTATAAATTAAPTQAPVQDPTPAQPSPAPAPVAAQPTPPAPVPVAPAPSPQVAETQPAQDELPWLQETPQAQAQPQQQAQPDPQPQAQTEPEPQSQGLVQIHTAPESQPQPRTQPSSQTSDDIVKVTARGVGTNRSEALADAYNNAIKQAIGLYVDAETIVKNDQIIKDQILTHSRGMIKHFDIVDEDVSGGLTKVTILAEVEKKPLIESVKPFTHSVAQIDGKNLHAQIVTEKQQAKDAQALLDEALKPFNDISKFLIFKLHEYKIDEDDKTRLHIFVNAEIDKNSYSSATQKLIDVLNQISTHVEINKDVTHTNLIESGILFEKGFFMQFRRRTEKTIFINTWQSKNKIQTRWNIFSLSDDIILADLKPCNKNLSISIFDKNDELVAIGSKSICTGFRNFYQTITPYYVHSRATGADNLSIISPHIIHFYFHNDYYNGQIFLDKAIFHIQISIEIDSLLEFSKIMINLK